MNFWTNLFWKNIKNKVIILDNASSHRNKKVKDLIQEKNKLLYSVPYQHNTNAIENFFSVLKNKLIKCNGIGNKELLKNIKIILIEINKYTYRNIFEGNYKRKRLYKPTKH